MHGNTNPPSAVIARDSAHSEVVHPHAAAPALEEILSREDAVQQIRRYKRYKDELEEQRHRGKEYIKQVRAEVEEDLKPLEERTEALEQSLINFVELENSGRSYRVPGLGTAYTTDRTRVRISDREAFEASLGDAEQTELYDRKLNESRAKAYAADCYGEDGEIVPGIEIEPYKSFAVRPAPANTSNLQKRDNTTATGG